MSRNHNRSNVLREFAGTIVAQIPADELAGLPLEDAVTSLVRQWNTYDGHASIISPEKQLFFKLTKKDGPRLEAAGSQISSAGWFRRLVRDWDVDLDQLYEVLPQLNIGQSVELENRQGVALRLWFNPKENSKGVEPVEPAARQAGQRRDFHKIASDIVDNIFGENIEPSEKADLITSVARQWITFEGHGLILTRNMRFMSVLTAKPDGGTAVEVKRLSAPITEELVAWGISLDAVGEAIHCLNVRQTAEVADARGGHLRLCADPRSGRIYQDPDEAPAGPTSFQFDVGF